MGHYTTQVEDMMGKDLSMFKHHYSDGYDTIYPSQLGIHVFNTDKQLISSASVSSTGGATGLHELSVIADKDRIALCCGDNIFCLTIPGLALLWRTQADDATCFQIHPFQNDYIVFGEINITRLNADGNIIWQQSGADIFVTMDGTPSFTMTENYIEAVDFEYRRYRFGYDGEILEF